MTRSRNLAFASFCIASLLGVPQMELAASNRPGPKVAKAKPAGKSPAVSSRPRSKKSNTFIGRIARKVSAGRKKPGLTKKVRKYQRDLRALRFLTSRSTPWDTFDKTSIVESRNPRALAEIVGDNFANNGIRWNSDTPAANAARAIVLATPAARSIFVKHLNRAILNNGDSARLLGFLFSLGAEHGFHYKMIQAIYKNGLPLAKDLPKNSAKAERLLTRAKEAAKWNDYVKEAQAASSGEAVSKISSKHQINDYTRYGMVPYVQQKQMGGLEIEETRDLWSDENADRDPLALAIYELVRYRVGRGLQHPEFGGHNWKPMVNFGTASLVGVVKRLASSSAQQKEKFHRDVAHLMGTLRASRVRSGDDYLSSYDPEVASTLKLGGLMGGPHEIEETKGAGNSLMSLLEAHFAAEEPALAPLLQITTETGSREFFSQKFNWAKRRTQAEILRDYKPAPTDSN